MKRLSPATAIPGTAALLGIALLIFWTTRGTVGGLAQRRPAQERPPGSVQKTYVPVVGTLIQGDGVPADVPGAWPRFRGAGFDAICAEGPPLSKTWPQGGPPVLWSLAMGEGYAAAAVLAGRVYVLDYDRRAAADALRCLSLDDGREIWRFGYGPVAIKRYHGMSRTIPAVTGKYVVSLGPMCHVACLDAETGQQKWLLDMVHEYDCKVPQWYAGQCPLVDGDRVILAPGADEALLMAVDCETGRVLWKTPNPPDPKLPQPWAMTHSSIMPMELAGRRTYVYCGKGGVVGVSADDGSVLWHTTAWKISIATCPSPLVLPEGRIFFCGGYNSGALMMRVKETGGKFKAEKLFRLKPKQFGSEQQTPVFFGGCIYGVRQQDNELVCLDLEGEEVWSSGRQARFGSGPYMIADGMIYVMDNEGVLTLAEATPKGYRQLARAEIFPDGHDAWGPMAMAGARLIVRDFTRMACLDVAER